MAAPLGVIVALLSEAKTLGLCGRRPGLQALGALRVHVCGIGEAAAQAAAAALIDEGCAALLSYGTAGALDGSLAPGDLVCPDDVLHMDGARYVCDAAWRARLVAACEVRERSLLGGTLLSTRQTLLNAGIKYLARAQSGALAVDQESAAVAAVAARHGLPFLALRAIVDDAEATLPNAVIDGIDAYGRPRPLAMLGGLLKAPWELGKLPGLASDFAAASAALRDVHAAAPEFAFAVVAEAAAPAGTDAGGGRDPSPAR